jgi:hypothetical protein
MWFRSYSVERGVLLLAVRCRLRGVALNEGLLLAIALFDFERRYPRGKNVPDLSPPPRGTCVGGPLAMRGENTYRVRALA